MTITIDYKKELEAAAKNMILIHQPDLLIKMILRTIVQKVRVSHAGILLHHQDEGNKDAYILTVSRGLLGLKIPAGFVRLDTDNSLIRFFRERQDKQIFNYEAIVYDEAKVYLEKDISDALKKFLQEALYQMEIFGADVCIPSYFRKELLGVLLLGKKKNDAKFEREELDFFTALSSNVAMAIRNAQLFKELGLELDRKRRLFIHTTIALAAAIDAKDHYTHGHTARVTNLSLLLAQRLMQKDKQRFDTQFLESLHIAALLHDIGKIGIPESILNKNGPLDVDEKKKMQEHPLVGVTILQPIRELGETISGVKYHHERYDGSGYPEGLKGSQIPLIATIISLADAFDAMTTDRPYRRALSKEEAAAEIERQKGKQFDPEIAAVFLELYKDGKI
jgi:HD-GYP domain-containing protein (c-di-GMP phosphodiesterase class II)